MSPLRREEREGRNATLFLRALRVFAVICFFCFAHSSALAVSSTRAELSMRLPQAKLDNVTFSDALDYLRDVAGLNIHVDWKSLQAANVSKDAEINLNLHDVSAGKVLSLVLSEAGPGDLLTFYIDQNVLEITTRQTADQQMITVVYYVQDLIQPNETFNYQIQNIASGSAQVTGSGGSGSSTSFQSGQSGNQTGNTQDKEDALIKLIETVIRPEVWKDNGGAATMSMWNGNLIVTAPRSVQEAIGGPVDR